MKISIGTKIKDLRHKNGLSQVDLARLIGVSKQTLYKYENDIITNIPSDKIEAIAHVLDTTPSFLMGWDEKELNGVGRALKELTHNSSKELTALSINANIPIELLNDIVDEHYTSIPADLLAQIADYYNVGMSRLLRYNTCRLSKELSNYVTKHDMEGIDNDRKLADFLLTIGYELNPDALSGNKAYTLTDLGTKEITELSMDEFALFRRMLKRNVSTTVEFIRELQQ